jgi:hypothetical protein
MNDQTTIDAVNDIRRHHRRRRFAMKIQQKLDRALESFLRVNTTEWSPDLPDAEREKINKEVKQLIKEIRSGKTSEFADVVHVSDEARAPADAMREASEKRMGELAMQLPVYPWIESVHGAGALGLATIVAEAGDLSGYPQPAKLWKRLGFAPFEGLAGSSWKRDKWRPRALTSEEWKANPFSGERYALMHQIAVWLVNAQWIGKAKSDTGEGKPNGPYGQVYAERRKHTTAEHPDWSDMHRRMDAVRITMKRFLLDLHVQWRLAAEGVVPAKKMRAAAKPKKVAAKRSRSRVKEAA